MVKIIGRMEEGTAPVAPSEESMVDRGMKVLGRMGTRFKLDLGPAPGHLTGEND